MKIGTMGMGLTLGIVTLLSPVLPAHGAFKEVSRLITIEAEHYATNKPASSHYWQAMTNRSGFVGASAMQALPDNGTTISSNIQSNSPALTYLAIFTNAGSFNFWVRGWAGSKSADSFYIGVDGNAPQAVSFSKTSVWEWQSKQVSINTVGMHQINIWMREDGVYVDRLVLAANLSYTPSGNGPAETQNLPPVVRFTSPADGSSFHVGTTLALSAAASDPDGSVVRLDFLMDGALLASFANPPYSMQWTPPLGTHVVQAIATDNDGATNANTAITVAITNLPPVVQITSPPDGLSFRAGTTLALSANASDPDGSVVRLDFLSDGVLQASFANPPYFMEWIPTAGVHQVRPNFPLRQQHQPNLCREWRHGHAYGNQSGVAKSAAATGGPAQQSVEVGRERASRRWLHAVNPRRWRGR